jgi:hypothetical protein
VTTVTEEIEQTATVATATKTETACQTAMAATGTAIGSVTVSAIGTAVVVAERTLDASDPVRMTAMMTVALEDDTKRSPVLSFRYGPSPFPSQSRLAGGYP